ncbi:MAG: SGNH/GDSL hydrolase family protein [Thermomicrobiales bacterium]|nr:SGNH/GDSL hydrolase family protein [Thermomicrobiales bacterium]
MEERVLAKTVLCYGDSNTYGAKPDGTGRFAPEVRWPGVVARVLGDGYRVIEEGLNGRTTRWDDPIELGRNGLTTLLPIVESHNPIDLMTIMLGTNDLKARFRLNASDIAQSAGELGAMAKRLAVNAESAPAVILLIAPPPTTTLTQYDLMFEGAFEKSRQFAEYYRRAAGWYGLEFFDAGSAAVSSELDGIHFDADQHQRLGEALAAKIQSSIG